jgi:hypothetical protein
MRANAKNLRKLKADLVRQWKITEEQWGQLLELALKRSWEDHHTPGHHPSFAQFAYMEQINKAINGFGVEPLPHSCVPNVEYVNMGDAYVPTAILRDGKLYLGCWADMVEKYCSCEKEVPTG